MGGSKKKSASKRKAASKPAKSSVRPASPAATRSKTTKKSSLESGNAVASPAATPPTVQPPVISESSTPESSNASVSSDVSALEKKFDDRMSKMETSFRASITEMMTAQAAKSKPVVKSKPATPPSPPPTEEAVVGAVGGSSRSSSTSSASDCSDSDSSRSSSSARSSSSSRSRSRSSRRHRHRRHRRSRRRSRSSSKPRHSKYSSARYLKENEKVKNYPRMVLVNVRMALALLRRKKDIKPLLKHMLLVAEKADTDMFMDEALISYDESMKDLAKESGINAFKKVDPSVIMKHLCYDGTKAAANARRAAAATKKPAGAKPVTGVGHCIKFNYDSKGCPRGRDCFYKHVCSACGSPSHGNPDCTSGTKSKQK